MTHDTLLFAESALASLCRALDCNRIGGCGGITMSVRWARDRLANAERGTTDQPAALTFREAIERIDGADMFGPCDETIAELIADLRPVVSRLRAAAERKDAA